MSVTSDSSKVGHVVTPQSAIDELLVNLHEGAVRLAASSLDERIGWARACVESTYAVAADWVREAGRAKRIPSSSSALAEEILYGPVSILRYLQLIIQTLKELRSRGEPRLPGQPMTIDGQVRVPTFPTRTLYDALVFNSITAETWLQPNVDSHAIFGDAPARLARRDRVAPRVTLVLGAGNVSAIPATDALSMIFQNDCAVLLKMNPINEYLGPVFEQALQPLIRAGVLRIVYGGADLGRYAVNHPKVDSVHITGSTSTHDAIVWGSDAEQVRRRKQLGQPLISKPVISELGNVTPWIIVPGEYTEAQLMSQAENIAASIINNASFNCIASKILITWKHWPARDRFLDMICAILDRSPTRYAYYLGAAARFAEFSGGTHGPDDQGNLPWTLRRDVDPQRESHLFQRESFVCVTGEMPIDAATPLEFLSKAVEFANEHICGSLAVALTVPDELRKKHSREIDAAIKQLRYGTVCINQWSGIAFGLMSTPWGAYPVSDLSRIQSGIGFVHNTYLLDRPQKSVFRSPLVVFPKPVWFSTNRRAQQISWRLLDLYRNPSFSTFLGLLTESLRG